MIVFGISPLAVGVIAIVSCSHAVVFFNHALGFLLVVGALEHFYDALHPRRHIRVDKHVEAFALVFEHVIGATTYDDARALFCDFLYCIFAKTVIFIC